MLRAYCVNHRTDVKDIEGQLPVLRGLGKGIEDGKRDEISRGVYQVRTHDERISLSLNQYLVIDQKPVLIHTGAVQMLDGVR